jgi:hypothetical protein
VLEVVPVVVLVLPSLVVVPVEVAPVLEPLNKSPNKSSRFTSDQVPVVEPLLDVHLFSVVEVTAESAETNTNDLTAEVVEETFVHSANIQAFTAACL